MESQLYIMDQLGRVIRSLSAAGGSVVIDLEGLGRGLYILGGKSNKGARSAIFVVE